MFSFDYLFNHLPNVLPPSLPPNRVCIVINNSFNLDGADLFARAELAETFYQSHLSRLSALNAFQACVFPQPTKVQGGKHMWPNENSITYGICGVVHGVLLARESNVHVDRYR